MLKPVVLIIAGSDNSAKAGLEQDLRIAEYLGFETVTVCTGRTLQSPENGLEQLQPPSTRQFRRELKFAFSRFDIKAIKIGALTQISQARQLKRILSASEGTIPVVLDPVFKPTTGRPFIHNKQIAAYLKNLLPISTVATPNSIEAGIILKALRKQGPDRKETLREVVNRYGASFLVTGGHGPDVTVLEELLVSATCSETFRHPRLRLSNTRGTGCVFSTALACRLYQGKDLKEAAKDAIADTKAYLLHRDGILNNSSTEPIP